MFGLGRQSKRRTQEISGYSDEELDRIQRNIAFLSPVERESLGFVWDNDTGQFQRKKARRFSPHASGIVDMQNRRQSENIRELAKEGYNPKFSPSLNSGLMVTHKSRGLGRQNRIKEYNNFMRNKQQEAIDRYNRTPQRFNFGHTDDEEYQNIWDRQQMSRTGLGYF